MKKIYIIPALNIVEIHCETLIADSLKFRSGEVSEENNVLSKENQGSWGNIWDDDEE